MNFSALRGLCMFGVLRRFGAKTETEMQFTSTRSFTLGPSVPLLLRRLQIPAGVNHLEPEKCWALKQLDALWCTEVSCAMPKTTRPKPRLKYLQPAKALDSTKDAAFFPDELKQYVCLWSIDVYRNVRNSSGSFSKQLVGCDLSIGAIHSTYGPGKKWGKGFMSTLQHRTPTIVFLIILVQSYAHERIISIRNHAFQNKPRQIKRRNNVCSTNAKSDK